VILSATWSAPDLQIRAAKAAIGIFELPKGIHTTVSSKLGDDAKPYQKRVVKKVIEESKW
jgi:hypothetical protein